MSIFSTFWYQIITSKWVNYFEVGQKLFESGVIISEWGMREATISYVKKQLQFATKYITNSAGMYLFKVNNGKTRIINGICSKLTIMMLFWCLCRVHFIDYSDVSIVDFEQLRQLRHVA